tara:strand:- start:11819 stop:13138 length:1320 start_codon:yes stop_codon:yes gene_type:complete
MEKRKTMNKLGALVLGLFTLSVVAAQDASEYVVTVASGIGAFGPEEPSININRKKTKHQVIGTNINRLFVSHNGGKTWDKKDISSQYGIWGDPVIASNSNGDFFFFHLSWPGVHKQEKDSWLDRMVIQKSEDFGETWPKDNYTGLNAPKDQDKQWVNIDPETGKMHMTWTQFDEYDSKDVNDITVAMYSSSMDGETWSKAQRISTKFGNCLDLSQTLEGIIPAAGNGDKVHSVWMLGDSLYYNDSNDDGKTWNVEKGIFKTPGWEFDVPGINRTNGFPSFLSVNENGTDVLYLSWSDQTKSYDDTEVWNAMSKDGGKTWSEQKPLSSTEQYSKGHQFFSNMYRDSEKGTFYWLFYDRSAYDDHKTDIVLAWADTFEGEKKFIKLNKEPFTPKKEIFFGDYIQVDAHKGVVRPVWTEFINGNLVVKTALLSYKKLNKLVR